jgi:hypothetical protein
MPPGMAFPMIGARNRNWCREPEGPLVFAFTQTKRQVKFRHRPRTTVFVGLSLELKRRSQMMASPHLRTIMFSAFAVTLLGFY